MSQKYTVNVIRHAQSEYNLAQLVQGGKEATETQEAECKKIKFNPKYYDAGITEEGYKQTETAREECKERNIKLVVVSPLRRALQTCHEIFKNHKNQPKIIVNPLFREMCLSSCDIGCLIGQSQTDFPHFNFDFLKKYENKNLWVLDELNDQETVKKIKQQIRNESKDEEDYQQNGQDRLLKVMEGMFPNYLEQQQDTNERSLREREAIIQLAREHNIKEDEEIAFVGHSRNQQAFTCTKFGEDGSIFDGKWLENCEVYQMKL